MPMMGTVFGHSQTVSKRASEKAHGIAKRRTMSRIMATAMKASSLTGRYS